MSNPGFRNDIIIRGGSPVENKFFMESIEVPVIIHFQTQGSSGGPVGIINADLIRNVDFYSSAFQSNRGNALSSVIEFTQKDESVNNNVTDEETIKRNRYILSFVPVQEQWNYTVGASYKHYAGNSATGCGEQK